MKADSSRGFSLLEIVIAMLILSVVVAGIFSLFITSTKFINEAGHRLQAINYARMVAENLKVYVSADPDTPSGAGTALGNGTHDNYTDSGITLLPRDAIVGATGQACTYRVEEIGTSGMKRVTITVSWNET